MKTDPTSDLRPPWLSVVIPVYNGEQFLRQALQSLADQSVQDFEVLVIDDDSEDRSMEIAASFEEKLTLRVMTGAGCGSWAASTNLGFEAAEGEYLCMLHQDDLWLPERCSSLKKAAKEYPEASLILHPSQFIDSNGDTLGVWRCPFGKKRRLLSSAQVLKHLCVQNFISVPAPIWKRSVQHLLPPLDPDLWFTADWRHWLSLSQFPNWLSLPTPLTSFRIHPDSQTLTGARDESGYREQYERIFQEVFESGDFPALPTNLRRIARLSIEMNIYLLSKAKGWKPSSKPLRNALLQVGALGFLRYLHSSRIVERGWARLFLKKQIRRLKG